MRLARLNRRVEAEAEKDFALEDYWFLLGCFYPYGRLKFKAPRYLSPDRSFANKAF